MLLTPSKVALPSCQHLLALLVRCVLVAAALLVAADLLGLKPVGFEALFENLPHSANLPCLSRPLTGVKSTNACRFIDDWNAGGLADDWSLVGSSNIS